MISAVIPTLNARDTLQATLESLAAGRESGLISELLIIDGGSTDGTPQAAEGSGARVLAAKVGRGGQLSAGAAAGQGAWLLFLHADTVLENGWEAETAAFVAAQENIGRAAVYRFTLDDTGRRARKLARFVAWRGRVLGLPYGDQGLLISRQLYELVGGFRDDPIMEDVDIIRRIGRRRLHYFSSSAVTSASRYRRHGYALRMIRNLTCLTLYFLGLPTRFIARLYG